MFVLGNGDILSMPNICFQEADISLQVLKFCLINAKKDVFLNKPFYTVNLNLFRRDKHLGSLFSSTI